MEQIKDQEQLSFQNKSLDKRRLVDIKKKYRVWWYFIIAAYFVSSVSILFLMIPVTLPEHGIPITYMMCGMLFWIGLVIGVLLWLILYIKVRKQTGYISMKKSIRLGIVNMFSNKTAMLWDCIFCISLLATTIGLYLIPYNNYVNSICMSMLLFSFHMHCLYNGKVYAYIKKNRRKKKHEKN